MIEKSDDNLAMGRRAKQLVFFASSSDSRSVLASLTLNGITTDIPLCLKSDDQEVRKMPSLCKITSDVTPSVLIPCKHFNNGNDVCPFGDKCRFSHEITFDKCFPVLQSYKNDAHVDMQVMFKSLPKGAMSLDDIRLLAEKYTRGGKVTNVEFLPEHPNCPGRLAGYVNFDRERAAWDFLDAFDNKVFKVSSGRAYVKCIMNSKTILPQQDTDKTLNECWDKYRRKNKSDNVELKPLRPPPVSTELEEQPAPTKQPPLPEEWTIVSGKKTVAKTKLTPVKEVKEDWPLLPGCAAKTRILRWVQTSSPTSVIPSYPASPPILSSKKVIEQETETVAPIAVGLDDFVLDEDSFEYEEDAALMRLVVSTTMRFKLKHLDRYYY